MSDYKTVIKQFNDLWELKKIPIVLDSNYPKQGIDFIGENSGKFTYQNYYRSYQKCLENHNYQILLQDESMISMYYLFKNKEEIESYNLSFIPSLNGDITDDNCEINNIIEDVENYLRIDFDNLGYKKILHEIQHIHLGLNCKSKNHNRQTIRLPIAEKLYPWDFIFLVLKLIYHMNDEYDKIFNKHNQINSEIINVNDQIFHLKYKSYKY